MLTSNVGWLDWPIISQLKCVYEALSPQSVLFYALITVQGYTWSSPEYIFPSTILFLWSVCAVCSSRVAGFPYNFDEETYLQNNKWLVGKSCIPRMEVIIPIYPEGCS